MDILVRYDHGEADLEGLSSEELVRFVLLEESMPDNTEVSISFVDDETMARLNEKYRGIVGPTDVLAFECDEDDGGTTVETAANTHILGDVIIAPDVARKQAPLFGTSFTEEIELLIVHGTLHLCGYDHMDDDDAEVMERREVEILAAWSTPH